MPAPRTATLVNFFFSMPVRTRAAGVDRAEVEEERLRHVLELLADDQLDEVARLDARCGVEVDLGALDRGAHDVARSLVVSALDLLAQVGGERRQERRELGRRRGATGQAVALAVPRLRGSLFVAGTGLDPRLRGRDELVLRRHDLVDEALVLGLRRLHARTLEQDAHQRVLDAEHADGTRDATAAGQQTQGHLGQADLVSAVDRDAVVRSEGDLESATEGRAVDRCDDGLADRLELAQCRLDAFDVLEQGRGVLGLGLRHELEVTAGEEGLLRRGHDDALDRVGVSCDVRGELVDGLGHRVGVCLVHRVGALAGVVEDQVDDPVGDLVADGFSGAGHVGVLVRFRFVRRRSRCPCRRRRRAWRGRSGGRGARARR